MEVTCKWLCGLQPENCIIYWTHTGRFCTYAWNKGRKRTTNVFRRKLYLLSILVLINPSPYYRSIYHMEIWLGNILYSCSTVNINTKNPTDVLHSAVLITEITFPCSVCITIYMIRQSKCRRNCFFLRTQGDILSY